MVPECLVVSILDFTGANDNGRGGDNWSYKTHKSSSQIVTTSKPTPSLYRPDALPVAQSTVSHST